MLDDDGKVELHGQESVWEPELIAASAESDVESFDSGVPVVPTVEPRSRKGRSRMRENSPSLFDLPGSGKLHGRFEPARLTQARVRSSVTKTDLASEVGVSAAAIGQYEAGVNSPRPDVLERLADALDVRPGFFDVGRPLARIDTVNAHFRSLRSARVSDRQKALATATFVWELTFALERYVKLPETDLPELGVGCSPAEAAALLRRHWGLPDGPIRHLVATAESRGVVVVVRPLSEIDAVDAFSVVIVDRPIIITTPRRSGERVQTPVLDRPRDRPPAPARRLR